MKKLFASILYFLLVSNFLQANTTFQESKELYIKYTKYPTSVYTQQRFTVELEARILTTGDDHYDIVTTFSNGQNIDILDEDISWLPQGNENKYTTKITYKVRDTNFVLPTLKLALTQYDKDMEFVTIKPPKIKYNQIAINQEKFSNIIANNLEIKEIKVKQYNNKMLMIVVHIETKDGNLEEFKLNEFELQGIEHFEDHYPLQIVYYYMVVPNHLDSIEFDYYNPILSSFIKVQLPIILEEDLVSTQTDLNPHNNDLLFYKQAVVLIVVLIFLLLYVKTKSKILIFLIVIFIGIFVKITIPNKKIYLQNNTKVYILPTKSSTVYKTINKNDEVEILIQKNNFVKVLFKNKQIGWIKQNDI